MCGRQFGSESELEVFTKPIEIEGFQNIKSQNNFIKISSGSSHFVVLTGKINNFNRNLFFL